MVRHLTPSQARSKHRQMQNQQRQAINKRNQDVRRHNQKVNQAARQQDQKIKQAVNKINRDIRTHNAQVRQDNQRLRSAIAALQRAPVVRTYAIVRTSSLSLSEAYFSLESQVEFDETDPRHRLMLDLPEQETANSLAVTGALLGEVSGAAADFEHLQETAITDELANISPDLHKRWHGALYALNPSNPDATRHFCTSAREIFVHIFDIKAPDNAVSSALPGCDTTPQGTPTRRSKIYYLLQNRNLQSEAFESFIEQDIDNVVDLFTVFNAGTHGPAGRLEFEQLSLLKKRVEGALIFVASIVN